MDCFPWYGENNLRPISAGIVDLDFGSFRSALGVVPKSQSTIYSPFVKFINTFVKGGFSVVTNEPGIIPLLKQSGYKVVVSLPDSIEDLVRRVLKRNSNPAFDAQLKLNAEKWVSDWERLGKKYGAEVIFQKYFSLQKEVRDVEDKES